MHAETSPFTFGSELQSSHMMSLVSAAFCMYDSPGYVGGPNVWLARLLPLLSELGIQVHAFVEAMALKQLAGVDHLQALGVECVVTKAPLFSHAGVKTILRHFHARPVDVCITNVLPHAYFAIPQLREAGIATVGVIHSDDHFYRGLLRQFVNGPAAFRVDAVVAVSEFLANEVSAMPAPVIVRHIPYGVPFPDKPARQPAPPLKLVYLGRLAEEQKRISAVTHAMCEATRRFAGVEGAIYGEGPDRENVVRILATNGAGNRVQLGGRVDSKDVMECLGRHDVLVLLSDYEGLPIVVMEAMACGVVPICLDIRSGVHELIEDGVTGFLVKDREEGFLAAVRKLHDNPSMLPEMSAAARRKIHSGYSTHNCARRWADLIHQLGEASPPTRPVRVPWRVPLPPQDPGLARHDRRLAEVPAVVWRRMRKTLTRT